MKAVEFKMHLKVNLEGEISQLTNVFSQKIYFNKFINYCDPVQLLFIKAAKIQFVPRFNVTAFATFISKEYS